MTESSIDQSSLEIGRETKSPLKLPVIRDHMIAGSYTETVMYKTIVLLSTNMYLVSMEKVSYDFHIHCLADAVLKGERWGWSFKLGATARIQEQNFPECGFKSYIAIFTCMLC